MSWDKVNIKKFKTPSADLAYWLGYIYGDGSIYYSKIGNPLITLYSNDYEIMQNYITFLDLPKNRIRNIKRYSNMEYYVKFRSRQIADILNRFGIVKNKTKNIFKKEFLPDFYFSHYVRGLFESDGYYGIYPEPRLSTEVRLANNDESFLKILANKLNKYGFCSQTYFPKYKNHNTKCLRIKSKFQGNFLKWLYKYSNKNKLTRKYIIAKNIIQYRRNKTNVMG